MSKIVQAINAMIANSGQISSVTPAQHNNSEYFFLYKNKYTWSISRNSNSEHRLYFYPSAKSVGHLPNFDEHDWENIPMVAYSDTEIATKEAKASFSELYTIIKEKIYGISDVLD
ncbi:MAG: hypothetical protein RR473_15775, partial [Comamonas sp.]